MGREFKAKALSLVVGIFMVFGFGEAWASGVEVFLDGRALTGDTILESGRTLVPVRVIMEEAGMEVEWNSKLRKVSLRDGKKTAELSIGSKTALANGKSFSLDVAPKIVDSKTYVPIRFISESLDREVDWNPELRRVIIQSPELLEDLKPREVGYLGYVEDEVLNSFKDQIEAGETKVEVEPQELMGDFLNKFNREYGYLNYISSNIIYNTVNGQWVSTDLNYTDEDFRKIRATEDKVAKVVRELELDSDGLSDLEKVYRIHNYLVNNTYYAIESTDPNIYTAYGALIEGKAVCSGYSKAFQILSHRAGVPSIYVSGIAFNGESMESHAWNKVMVDGDWYNIDVTWDDPVSTRPILRYDYFLKSDRELKDHHPIADIDYPEAKRERDFLRELGHK